MLPFDAEDFKTCKNTIFFFKFVSSTLNRGNATSLKFVFGLNEVGKGGGGVKFHFYSDQLFYRIRRGFSTKKKSHKKVVFDHNLGEGGRPLCGGDQQFFLTSHLRSVKPFFALLIFVNYRLVLNAT